MYLRNIDGQCLAHCIGDLVLADVRSLSYADELPEAACLVIWVYGAIKDDIGMVAGVGVVAFACGKGEREHEQEYDAAFDSHKRFFL